MKVKDYHQTSWLFSLGAIAAGSFGMYYCLPIILLEPTEQGLVVGLPFLSAAILYAVGLVCLTYIRDNNRVFKS